MAEQEKGRVQAVAQVLHDERHGADGYFCPAQGTAPHPKDWALAEKIVAALDLTAPARAQPR